MGVKPAHRPKGDVPFIAATAVTKSFPLEGNRENGLQVLRGVNLQIARGEIVAIVGASGAGKSTLLHILGTLDRPTSGSVAYQGVDVFDLSDDELAKFRNRSIGFVFQFHHLLPEFTAAENVAMPALIGGKKWSEVRDRATDLLREIGLAERADQKPPQLSGGEAQRVAIARALMNDPQVVLADEPSGNLDSANAELLHGQIWELSRKIGQTFVIVTHNERLARSADRMVRIADGIIDVGKRS
jgi:lipoprotein-releasing system ATP-binding protein